MKIITCFLFLFLYSLQSFGQFTISGTTFVEEKSQISELKQIYVCQNLMQAELSFTFQGSSTDFSCWSYSHEKLNIIPHTDYRIEANRIIFNKLADQTAYGVRKGDADIYFVWITDYSKHSLQLNSVDVINDEDNCSATKLHIQADVPPLSYYSSTGYMRELVRTYSVSYESMIWSEEERRFVDTHITSSKEVSIPETLLPSPPYKNTVFRVTGDQYLNAFGNPQTIDSAPYEAEAVNCVAIAKQSFSSSDNQLGSSQNEPNKEYIAYAYGEDNEPLLIEGSAPLNIDFTAHGNIPVAFSYSWEIATDPDFMNLEAQFTDIYPLENETYFKFPFERAGTFYVRLVTSNEENSCEVATNPFQITVYDSRLEVPNAFSPGSDGINDVFKVAYQSIIKFKAWIFNRWGTQLFHWSDPAQGWDGHHNGKLVPPGVYFYIIEAEGSDGRKYKLKGDINLFHESGRK
ncbi:MAG: gliding motility-associated C-terminal domain-containing protein [Bacteroidales bacterium]